MPASDYIKAIRTRVGTERLHLPAVSVVIFDESRSVLLVRAAEDEKWTIPGGMVEPDESPADAAVREVREETGLDVELGGIIGVFGGPDYVNTYANGDVASWVETTFAATVIGGWAKPEAGETLEIRYFSEGEALSLDLKSYMHEMLKVVFSQDTAPYYRPPTSRAGTA